MVPQDFPGAVVEWVVPVVRAGQEEPPRQARSVQGEAVAMVVAAATAAVVGMAVAAGRLPCWITAVWQLIRSLSQGTP